MCGFLFKYREVEQNYGEQGRIIYPPYTNGYAVHNDGNTNIILNNADTIEPGGFKSVGGNFGEIYDGRIDIKFEIPTPAPTTPANNAVFTFKYYQAAIRITDRQEFPFTV